MKNIVLVLLLLLSVNLAFGHLFNDTDGMVVRVGVWYNPPVILQGQDAEWRGIAIDTLRYVAEQKNWELQFVPGTFAEHLESLDKHQIDLLAGIAYSSERAKRYAFTTSSLISNWGLIYARPNSNINSLLDLNGMRVAVMRNSIHTRAFSELAEKFNISFKQVVCNNYGDVLESVRKGETDAGVVNRLFGAVNTNIYHLVETGIIFNPINIHYAAPEGEDTELLSAIDKYLTTLKADQTSVYYQALQRWLNQSHPDYFPHWLRWLAGGLFVVMLMMLGITLLLRKQIAIRTRELQIEVDERRKAQVLLDRLAYYDSLTGLPNRLSFSETLKTAMASARRRNYKVAVLFVDLDRFKTINDSLGHDAGDKLIVQVAKRLTACLREEDSINRFGGDEFVAILQDIVNVTNVDRICERMLKCMKESFDIGVTNVYSSVSIGVALYPNDDTTTDGLLKDADVAMYHAKEQGGNNYQFYNAEFTSRVRDRLSLETRLRQAVDRDEFIIHYQPIFSMSTRTTTGVEALIRWQDPERGMVPPDDFIPLAEETGLIVAIGGWVMERACLQVKTWENEGLGCLHLAVNVSSRQFDGNEVLSTVSRSLRNARLDPQRLELEITERMFLKLTGKVADIFDNLKGEGVQLSIDDFGTGYSSLSYLKQLPIDTLKIDRSFVRDIPGDKDDAQIASTIVTMAHGLDLGVVAEGIETAQQFDFLSSLGCDRGQGYYIAKPMSVEEFAIWFRQQNELDQKKA